MSITAADILRGRRSTFIGKLKPGGSVPDEVIQECLELATTAPTHKLTEPWRFTVFAGEAKHNLARAMSEIYTAITPPEKYAPEKAEKLLSIADKASHIVSIVCSYSGKVPQVEETAAVACAVENFWIALCAAGYGGYWSTGGGTYTQAMREHLGLGDTEHCLGFFIAGVPEAQPAPQKRSAPQATVSWRR